MKTLLNFILFYSVLSLIIEWIEANEKTIPSYSKLLEDAQNDFEHTVGMYHYLHMHPEIGFQEFETSAYIQSVLDEYNITYMAGVAVDTNNPIYPGTGVMAQIGTGKSPCVALRADIDALALPELVDIPYKSTHENTMHACGHDSHATMLLGAAKLFKKYEDVLPGTIKLLFQPAEEGGGGGMMMANEGLLYLEPKADCIFALHVNSKDKTGALSASKGACSSAVDDFLITVNGLGGHASAQMAVSNPIIAGADIVKMITTIQSQKTSYNSEDIALVTVTFFNGGFGAYNVVPDSVEIGGTIRAAKKEKLDFLKKHIAETAEKIASAYNCSTTYEPKNQEFPPLYNDPKLFEFVSEIAKEASPTGKLEETPFLLGGEDFSFLAEQVTGIMVKIGTGSGGDKEGHPPTDVVGHNSYFLIDEDVLPLGAALHATLAFEKLYELNTSQNFSEEEHSDEL